MQGEHAERIGSEETEVTGTSTTSLGRNGDRSQDDLRRPDPPAATRLNRLAVVVAAVVMSVTLLIVAFAVGGKGGEEAAAREEQTQARRVTRTGPNETFYDRPFDADAAQRVDPVTGLSEADLYGNGGQLGSGLASGPDLVPPPYGNVPSYAADSPYGHSGGYYEESAYPDGSQPRQPSAEEQALERAMHSGLMPQGFGDLAGGRAASNSPGSVSAGAGSEGAGDPLDAAYFETLSALQGMMSPADPSGAQEDVSPAAPPAGFAASNASAGVQHPGVRAQQFVREAVGAREADGNYIATRLEQPISPYEVREGTLVEAYLVTGIHSDLPGEVVAQVSRNVYDSQTQQVVLIPKGTRLIGTYDNQIALDQSRLLVAWTRMVFPDGRSVNLPGLGSKDDGGATGLSGRVNRHYWQAFGNALMLAVVGGSLSYATSRQRQGGTFGYPTPGEVMAGSVATELSRVATEILRGNVMRRPTVQIREGTRFSVFMNGDLALPPYAPQDGFMQTGRRSPAGAARAAGVVEYRR